LLNDKSTITFVVVSISKVTSSFSVVIYLLSLGNFVAVEPLYLLLIIDLSMRLAKAERRPDIAQIGRRHLERCVDILKASIFAPMHGVLLEEGKTIADHDYEAPPIAQGLKEQIEKMLIPFGLSV